MTAEDIRRITVPRSSMDCHGNKDTNFVDATLMCASMLQEIAAQLAELKELLYQSTSSQGSSH